MNLLSLLNILENTGFHMVSIQYGKMLAKANFRSIETSQLIYFANQLTGLYIMGNLIFSEFVHENGWNPSSCVFYIRNAFYYTNKRSSLVETHILSEILSKNEKNYGPSLLYKIYSEKIFHVSYLNPTSTDQISKRNCSIYSN